MSSIEIRERSKDRQEEKQGAKYCSPLREKTQPDSNHDATEEEWLQPEGHSPVPVPQFSGSCAHVRKAEWQTTPMAFSLLQIVPSTCIWYN